MFENFKPLSPKIVARWFVNHADREAGEAITQLKRQKLVYYADAWFLANFDRPLISEDFEAWAHGPALRSLYAKYRDCGWQALPPERGAGVSEEVSQYLHSVFEEYGQYGAKKLEHMTHEEAPWLNARKGLSPEQASRNIIPKVEMRNFYAKRLGKKEIQTLPN